MTKPGCFGVPSIYSFTSRVCGKCDHAAACQPVAHSALASAPLGVSIRLLRQHEDHCAAVGGTLPVGATLIVSRVLPTARKAPALRLPLNEGQTALLKTLPKRSADYLKKLMVRGVDRAVLAAAKNGENGFTKTKHRPFHLALEKLLEGGITKGQLRVAYCEELGWSETSSFPQVTMIWNIFPAMGLAVEQGCALVVGPGVKSKNAAYKHR